MTGGDREVGQRIEEWVRESVRGLRAYETEDAGGMLKLDAMESGDAFSAEVKGEWLARLGGVEINRYPDARARGVKAGLRRVFGVDEGLGIVLGNGSDELIQMVCMLVGGEGRVMVAPTPSFSMYELIARGSGSEFCAVRLGRDFSLLGRDLRLAIDTHKAACVFLAYPNNPSGNCFDGGVMEEVFRRAPGLVVVDEAYFAFCGRSFLPKLAEFPNVLVLRTLSKSGLAGLRLGALIGHRRWVEELEKVRLPYNINSLTQASAEFFLQHYGVLERQAGEVVAERGKLFARLGALEGVEAYASEANFILFRLGEGLDAGRVYEGLKRRGVLIKNLHKPHKPHKPEMAEGDLLWNCLRVTVGRGEENGRFLDALKEALREEALREGA